MKSISGRPPTCWRLVGSPRRRSRVGSIRSRLLARDLRLAALGAASLLVYAWLLPHLTWLTSTTRTPVGASVWVPDWLRDAGPIPKLSAESAAQLHAASAVEVAVAFTALYLLYLAAARLARGTATGIGARIVFAVAV